MTSEKRTKDRHQDDLEQLRQLLLGEQRSRLDELDQRVSDFASRAADVAEVLPSAFQRVADDPVLEAELEKPMVRTIQNSIKRDAHAFAEYLFPVMGPAIRRAVADALKSLVQRINVAMEHSFTVKGLRWRLESARTGVPFAQVVLHSTMLYSVQEAFLIARDTGLVLAHAHRDENLVLDEDAVAAMLSAIQSFIQDSLGISSDDPLRSAELGDRTLWVINGPDALLACVISGTPPRDVRDELMALLETIHARFGDRFAETDGVLSEDMGLQTLMQQALREEVDEDAKSGTTRSRAPIYWTVAIALLLVLVGWQAWHGYQQREFESQMVNLFRAQPGYVVSSSSREQGLLVIDGLRDPGSIVPADVLATQGVSEQDIRFRFKPFWSLEPSLVLQRLRESLKLSDSTGIEFNDRTLMVNGVLIGQQADTLVRLAGAHPLIDTVDLSQTRLDAEEAVRLARTQLNAPDSVSLSPIDGRIAVSGQSDIAWYSEKSAVSHVFGGWEIDFIPLLSDLQSRLRAEAAGVDRTAFRFTRQNRLTPDSIAAIDTFAAQIVTMLEAADPLGIDLVITLVGEVDGTGTAEQNDRVARNRVRVAQERLTAAGVDPKYIRVQYPAWTPGDENLAQRRVTVMVSEGES